VNVVTLPIESGGNEFVGREVTLKEEVNEGLAETREESLEL
jgi:hypothetical protein